MIQIVAGLLLLVPVPHGLLSLLDVIAELVQRLRDRSLARSDISALAVAQKLGLRLHAKLSLILLDGAQTVAQPRSGVGLRIRQLPRLALGVLFQPLQVLAHAVFFRSHLLRLRSGA